MNLSDWLEEEKGRASVMAERFGVTRSAISQWASAGVPLHQMPEVREWTGGLVTMDEMVAMAIARAKAGRKAAEAI